MTEITPAIHPRRIAPQGSRGALAVVPTATPPAKVAFWMWSYKRKCYTNSHSPYVVYYGCFYSKVILKLSRIWKKWFPDCHNKTYNRKWTNYRIKMYSFIEALCEPIRYERQQWRTLLIVYNWSTYHAKLSTFVHKSADSKRSDHACT